MPAEASPEDIAGDGEHLYLRLRKTGDNTEFVARELASLAGCRSFDVGFCGLKDRHAVTSQWFSLYRPGKASEDSEFIASVAERWQVLSAFRSSRKLRRGDHQGNRFVIVLRDVVGAHADIDEALARLKEQGAPNYFGPQRFGHGGGNLDQAAIMDPSAMDSRSRSGGRGRKGKNRAGREASKTYCTFRRHVRGCSMRCLPTGYLRVAGSQQWTVNRVFLRLTRYQRDRCGVMAELLPKGCRASWSARWSSRHRILSGYSQPLE